MINTSKIEFRDHLRKDLGIKKSDILFAFSGLRDFGKFENGPAGVLEVFQDVLEDGVLILPTFSYSWANGEAFDSRAINAPLMGTIANLSIGLDGFQRTEHPNFSVNILSKNSEVKVSIMPTSRDAFGDGSVFSNLYFGYPNAKILLTGGVFPDCGYRSTFIHTAQQISQVWYRYLKNFKDPQSESEDVTQLVRYLSRTEYESINGPSSKIKHAFPINENFVEYSQDLSDLGLLTRRKFGYGYSRMVSVGESIDCFLAGLKKDSSYGLKNNA
jgi:aminoglycoside N3'-acetyltransferase